MSEQDEPPQQSQQLDVMQRMLELAVERTQLAHERTKMSADRSKMSADRSRMSADRSRMSEDRSEMSAERSYLAAERTLSVWVRTAMALMVFGIAIDRFGLLLLRTPSQGEGIDSETVSGWGGAALVALGVLMAVVTGIRFLRYAAAYRRTHTVPTHHGPFLAPVFALLVAIFGIGLLILLLAVF